MRQRIKQTLSREKKGKFFLRRKLNTKILHSDKSTYTALRFGPLSGRKVSNLQRPVLFSPEKRGFREKMMSYVGISQAHNAYFYKSFAYSSTVPLVLASLALLFIFGMMMFPVRSIEVFADEGTEAYSGDPTISLSLADTANSGNMTITGDNKSIQGQVDGGNNVGYIAVDFNVKASNVDKYDVYVQSGSSNLVGEATGNTVGSIVADTTYTDMKNQAGWGYAVAKTSKANPETLTYRPIQTSVNTAADTGSATNTTLDQTYTLAFAANLDGAKADHYKSNIILSVAAGATQVATLYSITYNTNNSTAGTAPATQSATSDNSTYSFIAPTAEQTGLAKEGYEFMGWADSPTATIALYAPGAQIILAESVPSKNLYAVWKSIITWDKLQSMQQMSTAACNQAQTGATATLKDDSATGDSKTSYIVQKIGTECWMTENMDNAVKRAYKYTEYGGYYTWADAGSICTQMGDYWKLPTQEQYLSIIEVYDTDEKLLGSPYKFLLGGYYNSGTIIGNRGDYGYYWSATLDKEEKAFNFTFGKTGNPSVATGFLNTMKISVRCVVK